MKTLSLSAPDDIFDKSIEALCERGNYQQTGDLTLGQEGKLEFAKGILLDFIGDCIHQLEMKAVQAAIQKQQQAAVEQIQAANLAARGAVEVKVE